jgi:uncharacterized membrane protein YkvA (DUF1232 family)
MFSSSGIVEPQIAEKLQFGNRLKRVSTESFRKRTPMARLTPANMNLFKRIAEDLRLLVLLIRDYAGGRYRSISPVSGIIFILAVAYLLIPTDLISDFIPGLGQLDDAAVLLACLYFLEKDLYRYRNWKDGGPK